MRALLLSSLIALIPVSAKADSWCNFDLNFLNSKAIDGFSPLFYNGQWSPQSDHIDWDRDEKTCRLKTYAEASTQGAALWRDCTDFKHVQYTPVEGVARPSDYFYSADTSLIGTDYWQLQVLAYENDMYALETHAGEQVWWPLSDDQKGKRHISPLKAGAGGDIAQTTSEHVYGAPETSTALSQASFHGDVQYAFFERLLFGFPADEDNVRYLTDIAWRSKLTYYLLYLDKNADYLERHPDRLKPLKTPGGENVFPSDALLDLARTHLPRVHGFSIGYDVQEVVTAQDGSQWYRADERIIAHARFEPITEEMRNVFDNDAYDETSDIANLYSSPIREVYIPYRASDDTVLSVFRSGYYCD